MQDTSYSENVEMQTNEGTLDKRTTLCSLRRNWCNLVKIVLAIIGISVPLIVYSQPCSNREVIVYQRSKPPLDLFLLLDGSGSMQYDWPICLMAAANITNVIARSYPGTLRVGAGKFGSRAGVIVNFTDEIEDAVEKIYKAEWPNGGTDYVLGLRLFKALWELQRNRDPTSRTVLVMISDGLPTSTGHYELANLLRGPKYNISIFGILVSKDLEGEELKRVSSCGDDDSSEQTSCPWFVLYRDFQKFLRQAQAVATILTREIITIDVQRTVQKCEKAPWLWFLLLLLPLLFVLLLPCCISLRKKVRVRRYQAPAVMYSECPANSQNTRLLQENSERFPESAQVLGYPQEPQNGFFQGLVPGNQVFSGPYWNEVPTEEPYVNYDVPLTVPTVVEQKGIRRRLSVNPVAVAANDLGNGYIEEDYMDCRTLEEWAEDMLGNLWQIFRSGDQKRIICAEPVNKTIEISNFDGNEFYS